MMSSKAEASLLRTYSRAEKDRLAFWLCSMAPTRSSLWPLSTAAMAALAACCSASTARRASPKATLGPSSLGAAGRTRAPSDRLRIWFICSSMSWRTCMIEVILGVSSDRQLDALLAHGVEAVAQRARGHAQALRGAGLVAAAAADGVDHVLVLGPLAGGAQRRLAAAGRTQRQHRGADHRQLRLVGQAQVAR